jgi:hypothetical protein
MKWQVSEKLLSQLGGKNSKVTFILKSSAIVIQQAILYLNIPNPIWLPVDYS